MPWPRIKCPPVEKHSQLLDVFHPTKKVCDIEKTLTIERPDAYDVFKPPYGKYLDYSLSQTDAKLEKSLTKIHLQYTEAEYGELNPNPPQPPPPPKPEKHVYFHGRSPAYVFVEEFWQRKEQAKQIYYKERLKQITEHRITADRLRFIHDHRDLIRRIGPNWFMELSPKQKDAIDTLKDAIQKDLGFHTITFTKDVIAELGLVLRPNSKHVEMALNNCCQCPVEFLLVLYQLINPRRKKYSLNDKLLLSSVVHLTIRETLKELHIRIPSPPRKPSEQSTPGKKKPKEHYSSPYLEPQVFEPDPPKHTGIYENKHIQYPENPYFSYIPEMRREIEKVKMIRDSGGEEAVQQALLDRLDPELPPDLADKERELIKELAVAQEAYNELAADGQAPPLLKPSIYYPCDQAQNIISKKQPSSEPETVSKEKPKQKQAKTMTTPSAPAAGKEKPSKQSRGSIDGKQAASLRHPKKKSKKAEAQEPAEDTLISEVEVIEEVIVETVEEEEEEDKGFVCTCSCDAEAEKERLKVLPYVPKLKTQIPVPKICELDITESDLLHPADSKSAKCTCIKGVEEQAATSLCQCERCKKDREEFLAKRATYVISGTRLKEDEGGPTRVIGDTRAFEACKCLRNYQHAIKKFVDLKERLKAQVKLMSTNVPFVVGGVSVGPDGKPVYQLGGVVPAICPCLEALRRQEEEEKRLAETPKLPADGRLYHISGVHPTPTGNVFNIGGLLQSTDCRCMDIYKEYSDRHKRCLDIYSGYLEKMKADIQMYLKEFEKSNEESEEPWGPTPFEIRDEKRRIANLPEMPKDGRTYQVTGVRETVRGGKKVYELGAVKDYPDNICNICCRCCRAKMKKRAMLRKMAGEEKISEEPGNYGYEYEPDIKTDRTVECSRTVMESQADRTATVCPEAAPVCPEAAPLCPEAAPALTRDEDLCGDATSDDSQPKKRVCICGSDTQICGGSDEEELICECGKESSESSNVENRRVLILDKIPTSWKEQKHILQMAMQLLAEDGYPLAKLPDCDQLPIFKLWFQLRSGKYFKMEDREKYLWASKRMWRHISKCGRTIKSPDLPVSKEEGEKFTYKQSARVINMVEECSTAFYRKVRQAHIDFCQEYFPTLFTYEFPTPSFPDCFFSYCPSCEEQSLAFHLC